MSFSQLISILKARKWLALSVFGLTVLVTVVVSLLLPKTYTASASLVVNAKGADPITGYMLPATLMPGYLATQVDIIKSQSVALNVVEKLNIAKNPAAREKFIEATNGEGDINAWFAHQFSENLDVEPSKESSVITLSYAAVDPQFAAAMANAFAAAYIDKSLQLKVEPVKQAAVFFDQQLKGLRENVEKAQSKLSAYQKEHQITGSEGKLDVEMSRLIDLSSQLVVAQAQRYDTTSRSTQLNRSVASESPDILANSLIQGLKSELVQAESRLTEVSQRLGVNHPQYVALQEEVNNIKLSIQREIAKTSSSVSQVARVSQQKEGEIKTALQEQKARVLKLKSEQDEMSVLMREVESAQRIYDNALLKFGQTSMESQSGQTDISVLNPATPPLEPSGPKVLLNVVVAIVLGMLLAACAAMFKELIDRRVRCADDLLLALNLPLLADLTNPLPTVKSIPLSTRKASPLLPTSWATGASFSLKSKS